MNTPLVPYMDSININFVLKKDIVCISCVSCQVINGSHTPCVCNNVNANNQIWTSRWQYIEDPGWVLDSAANIQLEKAR